MMTILMTCCIHVDYIINDNCDVVEEDQVGLGSCETRILLKAFLSTSRHVTQISFSAIVDLKYMISRPTSISIDSIALLL